MAAFIVSYEEAVALGPTTVGGKGWNLGRLHRYGFAVPTGGILIAQAYTQFMQDPRVRAMCADLVGVQIGDVADTEVADKLRALRVTIEATAFSTDVEEAVHTFLAEAGLAEVPVAVRSSATTEDSAAASFAGMHESVLNVTGHQEVLQQFDLELVTKNPQVVQGMGVCPPGKNAHSLHPQKESRVSSTGKINDSSGSWLPIQTKCIKTGQCSLYKLKGELLVTIIKQ